MTVQISTSIQDEGDGVKRLKVEIGDRRIHFVYVPRTEEEGWRLGVSVVYRPGPHFGDPPYPTGFVFYSEQELDRFSTYKSHWFRDYFEDYEFSEEELTAVSGAMNEFFGRLVPS